MSKLNLFPVTLIIIVGITFMVTPASVSAANIFGDFLGAPDADADCAYKPDSGIDHSGHNHGSDESCGSEVDPHAGHNHGSDESCSSEVDPHAGHNHGSDESCSSEVDPHAGHDHGSAGGGSVFALTEAQRRKQRCEHNMAAADCRQCSFEVGVVHVSPGLLTGESNHPPLIQIGTVETVKADDSVDTIGHISLAENKTAHISPRTDGTITNVFVNLGDKVNIGNSLFEVISVEIGRAAAAYKRAQSLVRLARQELKRGEKMKKLRITSDKEVFRLAYELEQAQIELSSARQELLILGIENSEIGNPKTFEKLARGVVTVKAPVNGIITEKHAVTGEVVSPGTTVCVIADLTTLWVWARVYDSDISLVLGHHNVLLSKKASVTVAAFPDRVFNGIIDYISPVIDDATRTLSVRLSISNDERRLLPGMFCRISLPLGKHTMLAVPRYSVLNDGETTFVFVPFGKNSFAAKEVKTGPVHGEFLPILSGLSNCDKLVTKGTFILKSEVLKERMGAG